MPSAPTARCARTWRGSAANKGATPVIHGDVRFDNALVEHEPPFGRLRAVLVDWEHLDRGSGWDVAGRSPTRSRSRRSRWTARGLAPGTGARRRRSSRAARASRRAVHAFAEGYRESAPPETADADLRAGLELLPARLLNIAFLHAAWSVTDDMSSALALAGVAAGLFERPFEPGLALA